MESTNNADGKPPVVADFDPGQGFDDHWDALDYISRQPDPTYALRLIVDANIVADEKVWAANLLRQCPSTWEAPKLDVMQQAARFLGDMHASWEHPGYLNIRHGGIDFAFGSGNPSLEPGLEGEFIQFDYALPDAPDVRVGGDGQCSYTLSCTRISEFIRKAVMATCEKHPEAAAHPSYTGKQYRAVPILMYVPASDNEDADVQRALDNARGEPDVRAFYAEDFDAGLAVEDDENDLSAMIQSACPRAKGV